MKKTNKVDVTQTIKFNVIHSFYQLNRQFNGYLHELQSIQKGVMITNPNTRKAK